ncbi:MAG: flagellar hook-associated protein FlgL [Chloroflexota bacterium]
MRVTNRMLVQTVLDNLQQNNEALDRVQQQLSSGKRVTRPADDPVAAALAVRLRQERAAGAQFNRNVDQAQNWLAATDQALSDVGTALARVRELAVQASNDTYSAQDRASAAQEVAQLRDHVMAALNSRAGGDQYLFGGTKTTTLPFTTDASGNAVYNGDTAVVTREIGAGTSLPLSIPGSTFADVFTHLQNLAANLSSGAGGAAIAASLDDLDADTDRLLTTRAEVGAKLNRLDFTQQRMADQDIETARLQSQNEDLDFAEALTRFTTQQAIYRASLEVAGRSLPMSLIDFLR